MAATRDFHRKTQEEISMTREEFQKLTQDVVLLDGATGSNLMAAGMPRGICTEAWIMEHKEVLQNLQKAYVEAGSQIVYAPTFGGNRYSLVLHGLQDKLAEMNHALVNISREAVGHKVYVAGDITTTGKMMEPAGDLTYEMAYETYCEQIKVLEDAGVDLIAAETMINIEETLAALDAAASVSSLPVMCTMTVEADGSIFSGGNAVEAAIALEGAGAVAVGINCSVGPDQLVSVVRNIKENVSIPVIAKPNAGMPTIDDQGNAIYSMDAKSFAEHMKVLIENGASVVGGCCGTTPEFIREISRSLGR
jgi:5-methyltetrahydrofolate--homocysteine methyltransferase